MSLGTLASIATIGSFALMLYQFGKRPNCPSCKTEKLEEQDGCLSCKKCGYSQNL